MTCSPRLLGDHWRAGFFHLILALLVVSFFHATPVLGDAQEPSVRVEVPDRWRSATVSIYIFNMPNDGDEFSSSSITVKIAVWGADEDHPLFIMLDGEKAAEVTYEGMFTYEWSLRGSHHLLIRDEFKIFDQAGFNIEAPPPPDPVVQLSRFEEALETQFLDIFRNMLATAVAGVALGVQVKKFTRKKADIGVLGFALPLVYGGLHLADWYILVSFGAAGVVTYWLIPDFIEYFGLGSIEDQSWRVRTIELDQNGFILEGVGLKYWRDRFIRRKPIEFEKLHLTTFDMPSGILKGVVVKARKDMAEKVVITCDDAVTELLINAEAFDEAKTLLQELKIDLLKEQALNTIRKEKEIKERVIKIVNAIFQGREAEIKSAEAST